MADDDKKDPIATNTGVLGPLVKPAMIDPKAFAAQTAPQADPDAQKRRDEFDAWQKKQDDETKPAADKAKDDAKKAPDDPKAKAKDKPAKPPYEGEDVTYLPGKDDPHTVKWRGIDFSAGQKVRVKEMEHLEAIRGNRFFKIGDEENPKNPNAEPENANDYRAHVWEWMQSTSHCEDIVKKWAQEKDLRDRCEVGPTEVEILGKYIELRLKQMRVADGLSEQQVLALWYRYGVLDLPWRANG